VSEAEPAIAGIPFIDEEKGRRTTKKVLNVLAAE